MSAQWKCYLLCLQILFIAMATANNTTTAIVDAFNTTIPNNVTTTTEEPLGPEVVRCMESHLENTGYTMGHHFVLTAKMPADVETFCSENIKNFETCIEPHREDNKMLTDGLTFAYDYLCSSEGTRGWPEAGECVVPVVPTCHNELVEEKAWVTLSKFKVESEEIVGQCRLMKNFVTCVEKEVSGVCGEDSSNHYTELTRRAWRPFKQTIICDVYGPTGGVMGIVAGVVVAVIMVGVCAIFICCRGNKRPLLSRASTSL